MFNSKAYFGLTLNSRRAIASIMDFTCPPDCKNCPFYSTDEITLINGNIEHTGHCAINAARTEFPDWFMPYTKQEV